MSRSYKKAIYKDVGHLKRDYWKRYRRYSNQVTRNYIHKKDTSKFWWKSENEVYNEEYKNLLKKGLVENDADWYATLLSCEDYYQELVYKNPKELINDYDYSDYTFDYEYTCRYNYYVYYNWRTDEIETDELEHEEHVKIMRRK